MGLSRLLRKAVLVGVLLLASPRCHAQSNVYSVSIYAGGVYYGQQYSFTFPFPPYHYSVSEYRQYEDTNGLVIIDAGHEQERGRVLCRYIDIVSGSESFTIPLDRVPPKRARELRKESAERERREKAWLASGFFEVRTFTGCDVN